uniref:Transposase n=1 Tax=Romanomermis culicivorax TaxID=13658 RepID=A0A915KZC8_ROMCU
MENLNLHKLIDLFNNLISRLRQRRHKFAVRKITITTIRTRLFCLIMFIFVGQISNTAIRRTGCLKWIYIL